MNPADAGAYNEQLIRRLLTSGALINQATIDAFRAVLRHQFLPDDVSLERAYEDDVIVTRKRDGRPVSSASQPAIIAIMLEQLMVAPGHRVLEIGTGTGYNAALLARLAGPENLTTIEFDPELAGAARERLRAAGLGAVEVVAGDAAEMALIPGSFDRIILTASAWDIVPAWFDALNDGGVIVLPLSIGGPQASIAFLRQGDLLVGQSARLCGFMPIEGAAASPRVIVPRPGDEDTVAIHEWPESLPAEELWRAVDNATTPVRGDWPADVPAADVFAALALRGWRLVHFSGSLQGSAACFAPDATEAALFHFERADVLVPAEGELRDSLHSAIDGWIAEGQPTLIEAHIEATRLAKNRRGEAIVTNPEPGRYELTKAYFRYTFDLRRS